MKMNIVVQYIPIYKNYYKIYQMARKNINTVIEDSTHVPTLYVDKWVLNILLFFNFLKKFLKSARISSAKKP